MDSTSLIEILSSVTTSNERERKCSRCGEFRQVGMFLRGGSICKNCIAARKAERGNERKLGLVPYIEVEAKVCTQCGVLTPAADMQKTRQSATGLGSLCKPCGSERARKYRAGREVSYPVSVEEKRCSSCEKVKLKSDFFRDKNNAYGLCSCCKSCSAEQQKKYASKLKESGKRRKPIYFEDSSKIILRDDVFKSCSVCREVKPLSSYHKCKASKDGASSQCGLCASAKQSEKFKTDAKFRLNVTMTNSISHSLKGRKNRKSWLSMVPYTLKELESHLRKTLKKLPGKTWDDFMSGDLHIDHIIPKSAFNFSSPEDHDFQRCWALSNLRLLGATENLRKNDRLEQPFQPSLSGI